MIKHFFILISILICSLKMQGQSIDFVKSKLASALKEKNKDNIWIVEESSIGIELKFIDTFFINGALSPLNNRGGWHNKLDTLNIKIRLEENWSEEKMETLKMKQKALLAPFIERYIALYDSLNWKYIKCNKDMFLERPYSYLIFWDRLSKDEKLILGSLVRLPEKVMGNIGIFIDLKYMPCGSQIDPERVYKKIESSYSAFSEIVGRRAFYKCEDIYK